MSVNGIGDSLTASALSTLTRTQSQDQVGASDTTATNSNVSTMGELMGQLQQLAQADPAAFKQVMANIAGTLQTDAGNATGNQAGFLTNLADKFQQASQTGSMAPLQPPSGGHHGGHRHVQGYSGSGAGQAQPGSFDLASIIQDALANVNQQ